MEDELVFSPDFDLHFRCFGGLQGIAQELLGDGVELVLDFFFLTLHIAFGVEDYF